MKVPRLISCLTLAATLACIAFTNIAAAETTLLAEWLANGVAITSNLAGSGFGRVILEDTKTPLVGKMALLCGGTLVGTAGPNGEGQITAELNSSGEAVTDLSPELPLALLGTSSTGPDCISFSGCAAGSEASPIEDWPLNLPWTTLLSLSESGAFLVTIGKTPGTEALCLVLGLNTEDTCSASTQTFEVINDATTGDAEVPAGTVASPNASCTLGGAESAVVQMHETSPFTLTSGELLSMSSE